MRTALTFTCLVVFAVASIAGQSRPAPAPAPNTQKPGMAPRPALLFSETWRIPPHTGEETDENTRVTPAVVTNPNLEVKLYGQDANFRDVANKVRELRAARG